MADLHLREELAVFLEEAFGNPDLVQPAPGGKAVTDAFVKFVQTLARDSSSLKSCLRAWSAFIRKRDGDRCVACGSEERLAAHHICRKSFIPYARFQTGNGITLCPACHRQAHAGFNGRPDMGLPMDAQGGEKIETMTELYGLLLDDARKRGMLDDQFYFLSDSVLGSFKQFQGFDKGLKFAGPRLEQAVRIWSATPQGVLKALLAANGLPMIPSEAFTGLPAA